MTISVADAHRILTAPDMPYALAPCMVGGRQLRTWKHAPTTLRAVFERSRGFGDRDYVVFEDVRMTYDAHGRAVTRLAGLLHDRFAIRKGDRVAIAMRNYPEWVVAFWAAGAIGAVVVPLNAWWTARELEFGLRDCGAKFLFADAERLARLADVLPRLSLNAAMVAKPEGPLPDGVTDMAALLGAVNDYAKLPRGELPAVAIDPEDDATILYTSGTTGRPKGALGSQRNYGVNIISSGFAGARDLLRRGLPLPDPTNAPKRVGLLAIPLFHVTGLHSTLGTTTYNGNTIVMMRRFDPTRALELIAREGVTHFGGVPTIAWQILQHPDFDRYDTSSVQGVTYGGAPSAPELVKRIKQVFPAAAAGNGYGMTETSALTSQLVGIDYERKPTSAGPALPICDLRVVDEKGRDVAPGAVGELWVRGANIIKGYWNNPEATAKAITDGFMHTGDLVWIDDEDFIHVADRSTDMVIRGGENIYCTEVEAALFEHTSVLDAAVFGVPHAMLGEEPAAVVQLKPGAAVSADALKAHVAARIAGFKVPTRIELSLDPLPRNPSGKILKTELRERLAVEPAGD